MTLQLEVGKSYKNRKGDKVNIVKSRDSESYPFGASAGMGEYTSEGFYYLSKNESEYDLISEWVEEVKENSMFVEEKVKVVSKEIKTTINAEGCGYYLASVVPYPHGVEIVIGAKWDKQEQAFFNKEALGELLDNLKEVYELLE